MHKQLDKQSINSSEKLWADLLANKNFFGFEFIRNRPIQDVFFDFLCPEIRFAIMIQNDLSGHNNLPLSSAQKKSLAAAEYRFVILSERELIEDFLTATEYLTDQFSDLVRFRCDC